MDPAILNMIRNLSLSYEIALAVGSSLDLKEMLSQVLKTVVRKGGAYRGTVWLWNGDSLQYITGAGFRVRDMNLHTAAGDAFKYRADTVMKLGRPVVRTEKDGDFRDFCLPFTGREKEILLVPVEKLVLIHLAFTHTGAAGEGLAGILTGIGPKLGNAVLSCLNYEKLLAYEKTERRRSETQYRELVNNLNVGIYRSTLSGQFLDANPAFADIFGYRPEEIVGRLAVVDLVAPENRPLVAENIRRSAEGEAEKLQYTFRGLRRDGSKIICEVLGKRIEYNGRPAILGALLDITERKLAESRMGYLSTHDALTGLYNRAYFEERVNRMRGDPSQYPIVVFICDIDGLKIVNDTLGHDKGDELLKAAAVVLRQCFRAGDIIARIEGDEFAIILPRSGRTQMEVFTHRVIHWDWFTSTGSRLLGGNKNNKFTNGGRM